MKPPYDGHGGIIWFAALALSLAVSVLVVPPVETREEHNPGAIDPPVTIDILSKQVRLLREGTLKKITIAIDNSTEIRDTLRNERILARSLTFNYDSGIRIMADSRDVTRPVLIVIDGVSEDASCLVRLGGEVRRYPLPMTISHDKNGLRFLVREEFRRYALDSANAEYGVEFTGDREAVMALAHIIAARYKYKTKAGGHDGADFCDLTHCQVYRGRITRDKLQEKWMVDPGALRGNMFFHSRCGGHTLDDRVFSNHAPMQLNGGGVKDCLFQDGTRLCQGADSRWERSINREELLKLTMPDTSYRADGPFSIHYDRKRLEISLRAGNKTMSFPIETFRLIINRVKGWNFIRSNNFTITERTVEEIEMITFKGEGLGHCVGFCQHGAIALSRRGYNRFEILEHYYPELSLKSSRGDGVGTPYLSYCVFDLSSGSVLAISPGNDFINRKVPAGSVFKLIVSLYLASERPDIVNEYTYYCNSNNTRDKSMPERCWKQKGHGALQLKDAIPNSCNLYFASLYNRISNKSFSNYFYNFCRWIGIHATLPEISSDREWSHLLAGLDFRMTFTIGDYIKLVRFLNCNGSYSEVREGYTAGVTYDQRLAIFRMLRETCIRGTAGGIMKPYGAGCNYLFLPEYVKNADWIMNENVWGKTATVIDGTNQPVSYGMFIGGSGRNGIITVLRKGTVIWRPDGHMLCFRSMQCSDYHGGPLIHR